MFSKKKNVRLLKLLWDLNQGPIDPDASSLPTILYSTLNTYLGASLSRDRKKR